MSHDTHINGPVYVAARDSSRLGKAMGDVFDLMADGRWRSLDEISDLTGHPQASVSAHLRGLRSERFGCHTVDRKYISKGLHHYKLSINYSTEKQLELL